MNKKLFFSLLLLSSTGIYAMDNNIQAAKNKIGQMAESATQELEEMTDEMKKDLEYIDKQAAEKAKNLYNQAEDPQNIFAKITKFITKIIDSVMNFLHKLFGG